MRYKSDRLPLIFAFANRARYNVVSTMANHSYLRVWTRDFSTETMIAEFARFLTTAPLSATKSTFTELIVQPIDPTEPAVAEWDLRAQGAGPAQIAALAAQSLNSDSAYIALGSWDLWDFDMETLKWKQDPHPLTLTCQGKDYEDGIAATTGHFSADLGFEYFFTGHAGLLAPGAASNPFDSSDHPIEHTFRQWMARSRQSEGISRKDARKHPTVVQLGRGRAARTARRAQRVMVRGRRKF